MDSNQIVMKKFQQILAMKSHMLKIDYTGTIKKRGPLTVPGYSKHGQGKGPLVHALIGKESKKQYRN
jgi:hypothetical protein